MDEKGKPKAMGQIIQIDEARIRALKMAIAFRIPPKGCIFHSDHGRQYCSHDYQKILRQHALRGDVSGPQQERPCHPPSVASCEG